MGGVAELTYMAEAGIIPGARHSYPHCASEVSGMLLRSLEATVLHSEQFGVHQLVYWGTEKLGFSPGLLQSLSLLRGHKTTVPEDCFFHPCIPPTPSSKSTLSKGVTTSFIKILHPPPPPPSTGTAG